MLKKLVTILFFFLFLVSVYIQSNSSFVGKVLAAPVTSPITSPVTFFNLTGKVVYKQLGRLLNNAMRIIPAEGVMIKVFSFFGGNQVGSTTTDTSGKYYLQLPNGLYKVVASDNENTMFVPPLNVVSLKVNNEKHVDFQGLLFPHF
jgi:hypothetical protein